MRAAIYARVSTEDQAKEGTSIDSQLSKLRGHAKVHDWDIVGEYVDAGYSGKDDNRPELQRLIGDAKAGRFDVVAVWKLDRFFRKLGLLLGYKERLEKAGIAFVSVNDGVDTDTAMGRLLFNLLGSIAEWEREEIGARTKEGRYARYREGKWGPGKPLYGYRYDPVTKKLYVREDEAAIVRRIYSLYVYDRLGYDQIARLLNRERVARIQRRASRWYNSTINHILCHAGYKGEHPRGIECPPIIDPPLWEMAQKRREANTRLHNRQGAPWLFQAMIRCGLCGRTFRCEVSHGRRVYSCHGRRQGTFPDDKHKCPQPRIAAQWLEEQVWQRVDDALSSPESLSKAITDYIENLATKKAELEVTIKPVNERLTTVNDQLSRLAEDWVDGAMKPDRLAAKRKGLEEEKERLLATRAEIDPAQIEELEETKYWLEFWGGTRKDLDLRLSFILEGETPEEVSVQQAEERDLISSQFQGVVQFATIGDEELSRQLGVATTKRQLLDRLQTELWAYPDRVEVKAMISVDPVPQESNSAFWAR